MGMPVKLSDDLVKLARDEAAAAHRSITAQIEHWAELGRSVESALRHNEVNALKGARGDLAGAFPEISTRKSVYRLLRGIATSKDRSDLSRALRDGRTVYQSDPGDPTLIIQIAADGTRTAGRFKDRRFVPAASSQIRAKPTKSTNR
jgi:ParD-like antitoxin of type II bacterial toxin-antitoxin system